jgi:hypothetical protein
MATPPSESAQWQSIAQRKQAEQLSRIPKEWLLKESPSPDVRTYIDIPRKCGLLSGAELRITEEYDATALAEAIRKRVVRCVDVARAFCKVCMENWVMSWFPLFQGWICLSTAACYESNE